MTATRSPPLCFVGGCENMSEEKVVQCDPLSRIGPAGARVLLRLLELDPGGEGFAKVYAYDLSKKAGVTYLTAWLMLRALKEAGYVEELGDLAVKSGAGRPRRYYRLIPEAASPVREAVSRVLMKASSRARQSQRSSARMAPRAVS